MLRSALLVLLVLAGCGGAASNSPGGSTIDGAMPYLSINLVAGPSLNLTLCHAGAYGNDPFLDEACDDSHYTDEIQLCDAGDVDCKVLDLERVTVAAPLDAEELASATLDPTQASYRVDWSYASLKTGVTVPAPPVPTTDATSYHASDSITVTWSPSAPEVEPSWSTAITCTAGPQGTFMEGGDTGAFTLVPTGFSTSSACTVQLTFVETSALVPDATVPAGRVMGASVGPRTVTFTIGG